jgi:predicted  nucleic acid-binding Zn-ribbon protein
VLLANNDNCRENDLNALMVRLRQLRTDFADLKTQQETELKKLRQEINDTSSELKELRQNTSSEIPENKGILLKYLI